MKKLMNLIESWSKKGAVEKTKDIFLFFFLPGFSLVDLTTRLEKSCVIPLADALLILILFTTIILTLYTARNRKSLWGGFVSFLLTVGLVIFIFLK